MTAPAFARAGAPRQGLVASLRKLAAIFRIYLRDCFAYPAANLIWVVVDSKTAIVLPAVWMAAAGSGAIAGLARNEIVAYYLVAMFISQFVTCHLLWDMAEDIREGRVQAHLLRPISYFWMNSARNLAWRVMRIVIFLPIWPLIMLGYGGFGGAGLTPSRVFWVAVLLAHTLSFLAAFFMTALTLWTVEFVSLFRVYYAFEMFLSGRILPLGSLPGWVQNLADALPFKYMIAYPTDLLLGRATGAHGLLIQLGWALILGVLGPWMFRRGLRVYAGAGL